MSLVPHTGVQWVSVCFYKSRWVGAFKTLPERVLTSFGGGRLRSASLLIDLSVDWDSPCSSEVLCCSWLGLHSRDAVLWCWTCGLVGAGLWFLGSGESFCDDCSSFWRGGTGPLVVCSGCAKVSLSSQVSECCVWSPACWDIEVFAPGGGAAANLICARFLRIFPWGVTTVYDLGEDTFSTMPSGQA